MIFLRILVIVFISFAASRAYLRFKDKSLSAASLALWFLIWFATLVIVFDPQIADKTALVLGIQRGTDVMFFAAVMLLFYLVFRLYVKIESLDKNLTSLNTNVSKELHRKMTKE